MNTADFDAALAELLAACDLAATSDGTHRRVTAGDLDVAITVEPGDITVDLMGWHQRFILADEEAEEAIHLALDLVGAALFGALRVMVTTYTNGQRQSALRVPRGTAWRTFDTQGSRPWNPFAGSVSRIHRGTIDRPARYTATRVVDLPSAPWAGECGFFGVDPEAVALEMPVDGELDLHNFKPREIKPLVLAYIDECLARDIHELRIVHGKGVGNLRRTVHAILGRHPRVRGYRLGGHGGGSWGATIVDLSPGPGKEPDTSP